LASLAKPSLVVDTKNPIMTLLVLTIAKFSGRPSILEVLLQGKFV